MDPISFDLDDRLWRIMNGTCLGMENFQLTSVGVFTEAEHLMRYKMLNFLYLFVGAMQS